MLLSYSQIKRYLYYIGWMGILKPGGGQRERKWEDEGVSSGG